MKCFPFMKDISGKICLLVGGGEVALRKAEKLRSFGTQIVVCAHEIRGDLRALAKKCHREYDASLLAGSDFAIAATDDEALNARVAADCRTRGIPVNCVDKKELCDFYFPALITAGDVTIGISTGGASPALAAALRAWLEQKLPENLAEIARRAEALRGTMPPKEYAALVRKMLEEGV